MPLNVLSLFFFLFLFLLFLSMLSLLFFLEIVEVVLFTFVIFATQAEFFVSISLRYFDFLFPSLLHKTQNFRKLKAFLIMIQVSGWQEIVSKFYATKDSSLSIYLFCRILNCRKLFRNIKPLFLMMLIWWVFFMIKFGFWDKRITRSSHPENILLAFSFSVLILAISDLK